MCTCLCELASVCASLVCVSLPCVSSCVYTGIPVHQEWIETAYDTPVKKVNTCNYEGKIIRRTGNRGYYKRPDYKVAYIYLENKWAPPTGNQ